MKAQNKSKETLELENVMAYCYGTENYYRYMNSRFMYTDGVGIKSKANVHYIIKDLEYLGFIERTSGKHRSFKLPKKYNALKLKQENQHLKELLKYCRHIFYLSGYEDAVDVITKEIGEK